jgi:hypothetical protein
MANRIIQGYLNYYSFAFNRGQLVGYILYIIRDAVLRTLAHKYGLVTRAKVYKKFGSSLKVLDYNQRDEKNMPKVLATMFSPSSYKKNV